MRRLLVLLLTFVICSGQMCGEVPPGDNSGNGEPVPATGAGVNDYQSATWLVVAGNQQSLMTATSWALKPKLLATNAHVIEGIIEAVTAPGGYAYVFQHETGARRTIQYIWSHPDYRENAVSFTPDLGLILVDEDVPVTLPLASDDSLRQLNVFDTISLCGFPGDVTSTIDMMGVLTGSSFHPRVTCLQGTISSLRPLNAGTSATPDNTFIIQYDLPTTQGTSGSALFNEAGFVVGVHAMGFLNGGSYMFGIRADKLKELVNAADNGTIAAISIDQLRPGCSTTYFDAVYRFGFNPPPGWGLAAQATTPTHIVFTPGAPDSNRSLAIDIQPSASTNPYSYRNGLISAGAVPLSMTVFWAPANYAAYYFVLKIPASGRILAESHVYTGTTAIMIRAEVTEADWPAWSSDIDASLKSICVEAR